MKDVLIIGGGPSGVSAALYLKRDNYKVGVFTNNNSMLKKAPRIENYYGFENISGQDLYGNGINQLKKIGVDVYEEEVVRISKEEHFKVYTDKNVYEAKIVIIATGITHTPSSIPNVSKFEGLGLSHCATCDGFFFRNKKIGVIGNGNHAYDEAKHLLQISNDVTLFTNNNELKADFSDLNITIINDKISLIKGDTKVEGLILEGNEEFLLDGIFMAVGVAGALSFSKTLGIEMNKNYIKVDEKFQTNINGLYAIGDVIGGVLQIGKAVSDGVVASREINKVLRESNK